VLLLIGGTILLTMAVLLARSRWRRLKVFISFHHGNEAIARTIRRSCEARGFAVSQLEYQPRDHDQVISTVREFLSRANVMIAVPGDAKSFVDAEILSASVLQKPVIFIKRTDQETLPDTALRGYPVFDLKKLEAHQLEPLVRFVHYACNSWRDVLRDFGRAVVMVSQGMVSCGLIFGAGVAIAVDIIDKLSTMFYSVSPTIFAFVQGVLNLVWGMVLTVLVGIAFPLLLFWKVRAMRIVKQTLVTGGLTFAMLKDGLSILKADKAILECLEQSPLAERD